MNKGPKPRTREGTQLAASCLVLRVVLRFASWLPVWLKVFPLLNDFKGWTGNSEFERTIKLGKLNSKSNSLGGKSRHTELLGPESKKQTETQQRIMQTLLGSNSVYSCTRTRSNRCSWQGNRCNQVCNQRDVDVIDVVKKHYKPSYLYLIATGIQHNRYTNKVVWSQGKLIVVADSILGVKSTRIIN